MRLDSEKARESIKTHLQQSADTKEQVIHRCMDSILAAAGLLADVFETGGKVLLCGNGGSAADCQHMAAEFVGRRPRNVKRPGLSAVALTTDSSFLTAFSNDFGFEGVFEQQVCTLGRAGDALIAITTSGNSINVIRAVQVARSVNMHTIVLTGAKDQFGGAPDVVISIPSANTQYVQEAHLAIEHILVDLVESHMLGNVSGKGEAS